MGQRTSHRIHRKILYCGKRVNKRSLPAAHFVSLRNMEPCDGIGFDVNLPVAEPSEACAHRSRTDSTLEAVQPRFGTLVKSTVILAVWVSDGL